MLKLSKTQQRIIAILATIVLLIVLVFAGWLIYDAVETRRLDQTSVTLRENLTVEFGESAHVSDFIAHLEGELVDDYLVNTETLGAQEIEFEYINARHKKRPAHFVIEVVDRTAPVIYGRNTYVVTQGYTGDLTNLMLSGDDLDDSPRREIVGDYDVNLPNDYALTYVITDASGNETKHDFTLRVIPPVEDKTPSEPNVSESLSFATAKQKFKTPKTKVGIDVSAWQGEIDWPKVKAAGVEFAMIRLGYQVDFDGEYKLDHYFVRNVTEATKVGLPVGVYFYSYANSPDEAKAQAAWILDQIKDYDLALGVAFDWENWSDFNQANMSFRTLNQTALAFIDTVSQAGLKGLLYGSKNYLERFWDLPSAEIWLAQYYDYATYSGKYRLWQFSDSGSVNGIAGNVDLDVLYLE